MKSFNLRHGLIAVGGISLIPILYLVLMFDIRSADPTPPRINRHNQHVALAVDAYNTVYTNMPDIVTETIEDPEALAQVSEVIIRALLGLDNARNPTGIEFMEMPDASEAQPGQFKDLWSNQHLIRLDDNRDGEIPMGRRTVKAAAVVWSMGANGKNDWGRKDDIIFPLW
ncbi:MAG: hypothetical protein ACI9TH_000377 [Kiritimatiellia bacterium]|jgi:hypothetical protein